MHHRHSYGKVDAQQLCERMRPPGPRGHNHSSRTTAAPLALATTLDGTPSRDVVGHWRLAQNMCKPTFNRKQLDFHDRINHVGACSQQRRSRAQRPAATRQQGMAPHLYVWTSIVVDMG